MQNNSKKIILFDLDGTLTDSGEGILKSVRIVLDHYGIAVENENQLREFVGPPLRMTFSKYGVPESEVENAVKMYRSRYFSVGKFENRPYDGIEDLLTRLRADGYHLFVATTKPEDLAVEILRHFGLAQYFDLICGALIGAGRDSKSAVIRYLYEKLGTTPEETPSVMVGDTAHDVRGAMENGIKAVGVTWGYGEVREMEEAGAVAIVDSMDALYGKLTALLQKEVR